MSNVYFLYGNDELAISRRLREFEADFPDSTSADMNIVRLDAPGAGKEELNTAVNAMPFLAPQRLVILGNPSGRYSNPEEREKFQEFASKVPSTTRLVLYEHVATKKYRDKGRQEKEDQRHWLVKWGSKAGINLERYSLPSPWEMVDWIMKEAKEQGGEIEASAAAKLAEWVGVDTRQAGQEISKLLAYVNWERRITDRDVEAVSVITAQESIFEFVDALATRNGKAAQHLLHRLLENEEPFSLWGMVVRQFRLLLQTREIIDASGTKDDVTRTLGLHPFVAQKATGQAQRFSLPVLERIYHRLLDIDEMVKTSQISLDLAMDTLVVELSGD